MKGIVLIALGVVVLAAAAVVGRPPSQEAEAEEQRRRSRAPTSSASTSSRTAATRTRRPTTRSCTRASPVLSHQHTFVGNRSTNAFSNYGSLRSGGTTCMRQDDTAAYWVPALYQGTTEVLPVAATVYYRRGTLAGVTPFPNNLRMIAGDSKATSPQGLGVTFWSCGVDRRPGAPWTCRRAPTRGARSCVFTSASRSAGTDGGSTARITRATWPTRRGVDARRRTRSKSRRSRRSTAFPRAAVKASRSPREVCTARTPTSSTRGSRTCCGSSWTTA